DHLLLAIDVVQVVDADACHVANSVQPAAGAALAPAEGVSVPVDGGGSRRQPGLQLSQNPFGSFDQRRQFIRGHDCVSRLRQKSALSPILSVGQHGAGLKGRAAVGGPAPPVTYNHGQLKIRLFISIRPALNLNDLLAPIEDDMKAMDAVIRARLDSEVVLIRTIGDYIVGAGGKRMRPAMLLMVARALGYQGSLHHLLAAVVEFIHTATLLHDDVVDESDMRRGRDTANAVFGNAASVLVGDYLYSRSF